MAILTVYTRIFLTSEALNMLLLFPSVTYSLSTGSLVHTFAPQPSHQQFLTTTQSTAISYHNKCHCYPHHISPSHYNFTCDAYESKSIHRMLIHT